MPIVHPSDEFFLQNSDMELGFIGLTRISSHRKDGKQNKNVKQDKSSPVTPPVLCRPSPCMVSPCDDWQKV